MSKIFNIGSTKKLSFDEPTILYYDNTYAELSSIYNIDITSEVILVINKICRWDNSLIFNINLLKNANLKIYMVNRIYQGTHSINFIINHKSNNTHSELYFKSIIKDGNIKIYNNILIEENIINCSTHQSLKNLILGGNIECKPELRIHNDQVIASHGVSNKIITNEELYYLQQRGLSKDIILKEIERNFYNDIIEKLDINIQKSIQQTL